MCIIQSNVVRARALALQLKSEETAENCKILLQHLGDLLLRLVKSASFVGWSNQTVIGTFLHLWQRFQSIFFQFIHKGGKLSVILNSFVEYLINDIGSEQADDNQLVQLCLLESYREHMEHPKVNPNDAFDDQEEALIQQIVVAQIGLTISSMKGRLHGETLRQKSTEIMSLHKKLKNNFGGKQLEIKVGYLLSYYKTMESALEQTPKKYEKNVVMLLHVRSKLLVLQCIVLGCSRQSNLSPLKSLSISPRLKSWVNSISRFSVGHFKPESLPSTRRKKSCDGDGDERRASSVISGLLYRWLEHQCTEWQRELTKEEDYVKHAECCIIS